MADWARAYSIGTCKYPDLGTLIHAEGEPIVDGNGEARTQLKGCIIMYPPHIEQYVGTPDELVEDCLFLCAPPCWWEGEDA